MLVVITVDGKGIEILCREYQVRIVLSCIFVCYINTISLSDTVDLLPDCVHLLCGSTLQKLLSVFHCLLSEFEKLEAGLDWIIQCHVWSGSDDFVVAFGRGYTLRNRD